MGRAYGQRPSSFVGGLDEADAYDLDRAAYETGTAEEKRQMEQDARRMERRR